MTSGTQTHRDPLDEQIAGFFDAEAQRLFDYQELMATVRSRTRRAARRRRIVVRTGTFVLTAVLTGLNTSLFQTIGPPDRGTAGTVTTSPPATGAGPPGKKIATGYLVTNENSSLKRKYVATGQSANWLDTAVCGRESPTRDQSLAFTACVQHTTGGWYGGLRVTNSGHRAIVARVVVSYYTKAPGSSAFRLGSTGSREVDLLPGDVADVFTPGYGPTGRCVGVRGRPILVLHREKAPSTMASSPVLSADGQRCKQPPDWK